MSFGHSKTLPRQSSSQGGLRGQALLRSMGESMARDFGVWEQLFLLKIRLFSLAIVSHQLIKSKQFYRSEFLFHLQNIRLSRWQNSRFTNLSPAKASHITSNTAMFSFFSSKCRLLSTPSAEYINPSITARSKLNVMSSTGPTCL